MEEMRDGSGGWRGWNDKGGVEWKRRFFRGKSDREILIQHRNPPRWRQHSVHAREPIGYLSLDSHPLRW